MVTFVPILMNVILNFTIVSIILFASIQMVIIDAKKVKTAIHLFYGKKIFLLYSRIIK